MLLVYMVYICTVYIYTYLFNKSAVTLVRDNVDIIWINVMSTSIGASVGSAVGTREGNGEGRVVGTVIFLVVGEGVGRRVGGESFLGVGLEVG